MSSGSRNVKRIFLEAVERFSPDQWHAYLDQACGGDPVLAERWKSCWRHTPERALCSINPRVGAAAARLKHPIFPILGSTRSQSSRVSLAISTT